MSSNMTFFVRAAWDEEAEVFVSESNIKGLHIEAKTIDEFEEVMNDLVGDLIVANHIQGPEFTTRKIKDLFSTVVWERPFNEERPTREIFAQ